MVKHIILWKLKEEYSEEKKQQIKAGIKEGLEGLAGQIPGLTDIKVRIDCLSSSNVDVMLDSTFVDEEALHNYSTNPKHVAVADTKVRPYTATSMHLKRAQNIWKNRVATNTFFLATTFPIRHMPERH